MDVTLQYFDDCPNWRVAQARLKELLQDEDVLRLQKIETIEEAVKLGFRGSPTVLIEGVDPFANESAPVGLACRVYLTPDGREEAPSLEQLRDALEAARS